MKQLMLIGMGGALGAMMRYLLVMLCSKWTGNGFPAGTLMVNLAGCLAIGMVYGSMSQHLQFESFIRPLLVIGILGGFTTFSSFGMESIMLFKQQQYEMALLYISMSNIGGLLLAFAGYRIFSA